MSSAPPTASFSGKRLTVVLLITLLVTGGLFYWVATSYSTYNAARRQTDRDWRELATQLESRYQTIDGRLKAEPQAVDAKLIEQWQAARDAFTGTSISALQIDSAEKVESIIGQLPDALIQSDQHTEELNGAMAKYEASAKQQRAIGQSTGSKLLKIMLNLPDPKDITLH